MVKTEASPLTSSQNTNAHDQTMGTTFKKRERKTTGKNYLSNRRNLSEAFKNRSLWDKAYLYHMEELDPIPL